MLSGLLEIFLLALVRLILLAFAIVLISIAFCCFCLFRPFHRDNVHYAAMTLSKLSRLIGLTVEVRKDAYDEKNTPVVFIANHQNNYDIFTMSHAVQAGTVSVGKKSLKWIPFFGQMYWLTGNILIDRNNSSKAISTIGMTADKIKSKKLSVWLFPEGTRSNGRGLLPFKTGAFRTAAQANVPLVPVCASNQHKTINLNRWDNGKVIIEFLPAQIIEEDSREGLRKKADEMHTLMQNKIEQLTEEANAFNQQ